MKNNKAPCYLHYLHHYTVFLVQQVEYRAKIHMVLWQLQVILNVQHVHSHGYKKNHGLMLNARLIN